MTYTFFKYVQLPVNVDLSYTVQLTTITRVDTLVHLAEEKKHAKCVSGVAMRIPSP